MFYRLVFQDRNLPSDDGFLSVVGHPFLLLTSQSSFKRVAQSTDVMFAVLFLDGTSKGLSRILHIVIVASF